MRYLKLYESFKITKKEIIELYSDCFLELLDMGCVILVLNKDNQLSNIEDDEIIIRLDSSDHIDFFIMEITNMNKTNEQIKKIYNYIQENISKLESSFQKRSNIKIELSKIIISSYKINSENGISEPPSFINIDDIGNTYQGGWNFSLDNLMIKKRYNNTIPKLNKEDIIEEFTIIHRVTL